MIERQDRQALCLTVVAVCAVASLAAQEPGPLNSHVVMPAGVWRNAPLLDGAPDSWEWGGNAWSAFPQSSLEDRLRQALVDLIRTQGLVGATAAVSIDGSVVTVAEGFNDRDRRIAMKPTDRMLVGSSGKPFFAYVAQSLAAEGRLDMDAPVSRRLGGEPWFARLPNAEAVTMRHLLSHRSGIDNHAGDSTFAAAVRQATADRLARGFTAQEQIAFVLDRPAPFAPGNGFRYSDTGYLVAGLALERAVGSGYYDELAKRVLLPLKLQDTGPSDRADLPGLSQGYRAGFGGTATSGYDAWGLPEAMVSHGLLAINPSFEWTGGGIVSTSADLARWMEALFERSPWKEAGARMVAAKPDDGLYGSGIFVRQTPDGVLYGHPGGFPGYRTEVAYSPELGVGIAFQTNYDRADGQAALHAIIAAIRLARNEKGINSPR